jgi:hypothetical protein
MTIQPEQIVYPKAEIAPPETEEELFEWAHKMARSFEEFKEELLDAFNGHVAQTHAHPKAWEKWRLRRPRYVSGTSNGTTDITVPATTAIPALFVIDGELFEITSDLACDLSASGVGGLDTGAVAANTPYYLYGVRDSGTVGIIASASDPGTGPSGYTEWTYIGAVATREAAADMRPFTAVGGFLVSDDEIESQSHTGGTTWSSETFASMPTTTLMAYGRLLGTGGNNALVRASGAPTAGSSTSDNALLQGVLTSGATEDNINFGYIPIYTANTILLRTNNSGNTVSFNLHGWVEDTMRYK